VLLVLPTKRLEIKGASVDEAVKTGVKGIVVPRTVSIKNPEQCIDTVLTPGSLTADVGSMNLLVA